MKTVLVGLLAVVVMAMAAVPAHADQTAVSRDGRHWAAGLDQPLFDPSVRWVPGDAAEATFWVRNQGESAGVLTLAVDSADEDRLLAGGWVRLSARTTGGSWVVLARTGTRYVLDGAVPAGGTQPVTVRAAYGSKAGNATQRDRARLTFIVTLTDTTARAGTSPGSTHGPTGALSGTGAPAVGWVLGLAALCLIAAAMLLRRRGERHGSDG